ncbi:MAG: IS30 family transposase [Burkholderia sp.]
MALPRGQLRAELITCLRQARKSQRPRARDEDRRRDKIPNLVSIHDRPAEIDERIVPGHLEGNLIKDAHNASSVATLVERTSLFVTLRKMENATADAAVTSFNRIDAQRRLSLTYDQGRKMAKHEQISEARGIKVYLPIRIAGGSADVTRTPTGCCVSTCARVRTWPCSPRSNSTTSPGK